MAVWRPKRLLKIVPSLFLLLGLAATIQAQAAGHADDSNSGARGAELIRQVIEARGGARYLNFKTLTATGQFTPFDKGMSQTPTPFIDTIASPDRERVEFGKGKKKNRRIQVNVGKAGWLYDGDGEVLKDQSDKQIQDYLEGLEFDIDRLLRGGWKEPEVVASFAGREEIRPGERADVVLIKVKADRLIYLWLDRNTHLPMNLIYERTGDDGLVKHEVRFFQYVAYDGVQFPNIIDFYRNGVQESRVNYQSVKLDPPVGEELFAKPANVKAIK